MARFAILFIDRPVFAAVISLVITLLGGLALAGLPIAQYPEITPPTVEVSCTYPGASSRVVADTVAAPIEQQVVGVENMLYMSSQCTNDGRYVLTVTFEVGSDVDMCQVLVQNRVGLATPLLPDVVKQTGVSVKKKSPSMLLVVNLTSPGGTYNQLYLSNYATIRIRDELLQIPGVGDVTMFGQQDYSLRIWLDPDKMHARGLTAGDVVAALKEQNVQVAAGTIGQPPVPPGQAFQYPVNTQGRLSEVAQFESIVLKTDLNGARTLVADVVSRRRVDPSGQELGGVELGAKNMDTGCTLDSLPSVGLTIFQLPGSNALETADRVRERMEQLKEQFPLDVKYDIAYDTTPFVEQSIHEVVLALRDAIILVGIVVLVFLQSWRATLIPLLSVPVALVGTFAVMAGLGFSLNNLSLLGLVLAIGIVVDDAIVVVEAVEHHLEHGLEPKAATRKAMEEVAGPVFAISLVLMSVFIPCAFMPGISGQFFRQFALTIAVSTGFSALNSLSLSPALAAILLRSKEQQRDPLSRLMQFALGWFFRGFNRVFTASSKGYSLGVGMLLRVSLIVLVAYGGLLLLTGWSMQQIPQGFIPAQDKGYLVVNMQLPDAASLERTKATLARLDQALLGEPGQPNSGVAGVAQTIGIPGNSAVLNANGSNYGTMFVLLAPFAERPGHELYSDAVARRITEIAREIAPEAAVSVFGPPAVDGLGNAGGFKLLVRNLGDVPLAELQSASEAMAADSEESGQMAGVRNMFRASAPQIYVDVDRERCKSMGVPLGDVFLALQLYLGGYYVNDINRFGRTWQVNLQADPAYRRQPDDIVALYVRNRTGGMAPLASVAEVQQRTGPTMVTRYNGVTAAVLTGVARPGVSTSQVIDVMSQAAADQLPASFDYQWTELTLLQIRAGSGAIVVFGLGVVLVFFVLAAQYESWRLPLAVILVAPLCLLASLAGIALAKLDLNIFVQIGFVVLVGLASKNAILIVEFAREKRAHGAAARDATMQACELRLRPILMTSFAFILGVVPLMLAEGAGAEMRRSLGVAVFSGMLGVTFFGLLVTPVFYYVLERLAEIVSRPAATAPAKSPEA